ncbi:C39 family peptidase [Mycobacterium sp. TY814]|uniref:C39 family peptidase n=1 Tax=unclassified Mycobacterium TaxID=2642494 RepID=UPI0027425A76|nr:C39 family peptidase [Mycobacterium sp. TY814]MDP7725854.1 C39 family peptidase [Mycobacterium sp. TY814]
MAPDIRTNVATAVALVAVACSLLGCPGTAAADPNTAGMHGDPGAAAAYWRYQMQERDCGEMAVADVIGQLTGNEISEEEIDNAAGTVPSTTHSGPIYTPGNRTSNRDLPVLLTHYGIASDGIKTDTPALERALDQGRKVIAGVNNRILWNEGGDRSRENHFVVVTGIDTRANVVHLNDSGIKAGRDEQVSLATFEAAWATSDNFAVVTR